jgi:hypothetical protein
VAHEVDALDAFEDAVLGGVVEIAGAVASTSQAPLLQPLGGAAVVLVGMLEVLEACVSHDLVLRSGWFIAVMRCIFH